MLRIRRPAAAMAAAWLLLFSSSGVAAQLGTSPEGVPPPGPLYPAADTPYLGVGLSGGPLWAADPTLDAGFHAAGQFALWLTPEVALEVDVGQAILDDNYYGGELTVAPLVGYLVFSLPLTPGYAGAELVNLRFAVGGGRISCRHTLTQVEDAGAFVLQTGTEWVMSSSAKLFVLVDVMWANTVVGNGPIYDPWLGAPAIPYWDLETVTSLRIGVEFAF